MYPQNQSSGSGNLQPPGGGCSTTAAPGDDNCSFYRFLETMQQIHEEYSAKFNYEQSLRQFENSLNELNNVQRQLEYIEQNIKFDKQIAESLKNLGVDYKPSNMDQLLKSSYEGQYHKLVDKVNANLNKTVQDYQQYNNVVNMNTRLHRPYIRKSTRLAVENNALKIGNDYVDPNTGKIINCRYHLGHKYGHEYYKYKLLAENQRMTQSDFNNLMNNPNIYQIEDPLSNMSHQFEAPWNIFLGGN